MIRILIILVITGVYLASIRAADTGATIPGYFQLLFNRKDMSGCKGVITDPLKRAEMLTDELSRMQKVADKGMHTLGNQSNDWPSGGCVQTVRSRQ